MLYIYRLNITRRGSFAFLAVCHFNIYCCYLLGLLIYSLSYFILCELVLRFRPGVFSVIRGVGLFKRVVGEIIGHVGIWENTSRYTIIGKCFKIVTLPPTTVETRMGVEFLA